MLMQPPLSHLTVPTPNKPQSAVTFWPYPGKLLQAKLAHRGLRLLRLRDQVEAWVNEGGAGDDVQP